MDATIIWDLPDDAEGNVQYLLEHDVSIEEAEEVLLDPRSSRAVSRSSGLPTVFGWTSTGRYLAVIYELVDDDPLTCGRLRHTMPRLRNRRGNGESHENETHFSCEPQVGRTACRRESASRPHSTGEALTRG